jgi:hypothetical protein
MLGFMVGLNCGLSSVDRWIGWRNGSDRHGALSAGDRAPPTPLVGRLPGVSDQQAYERERLSPRQRRARVRAAFTARERGRDRLLDMHHDGRLG